MKILLIVPAYNEEENIVRVCRNIRENYPQYDFVVINDGSKDRTLELCKENKFPVISLPVNLGLAGAFQTGMKYAYKNDYDGAVQFDADGQHLPEYIDDMVNEMKKGKDIVIGSRFVNEKKPFSLRMIGSHLIASTIRLTTGFKIKDPTSGMRIFNRETIKEFAEKLNSRTRTRYHCIYGEEREESFRSAGEDGRKNCRAKLFKFFKVCFIYVADDGFFNFYSEFQRKIVRYKR